MAYFAKNLRVARFLSPLVLTASSLVLSCGQHRIDSTFEETVDGGPSVSPSVAPPAGNDDPADDDPADVTVTTQDRTITIGIRDLPAFEGGFRASIVKVDGSKTYSSADFREGNDDDAVASLELPDKLTTQAQLVEWNLRIERKTDAENPLLLKSLLYFVAPSEVYIEGPGTVTEGKQVAYRVVARNPVTLERLTDQDVKLDVKLNDEAVTTVTGKTDDSGSAVLELQVDKPGQYSLVASTQTVTADAEVSATVSVEATSGKLLLTTDKPIYKPGQTIQLRALALQRGGNTPVANAEAVFEVEDGKSNKVFKKAIKTDAYGVAATPFTIGGIVNEGTYKVRVVLGDVVSEKTVEVTQYALPKFNLATTTDKAWYSPGDRIHGSLNARYFFGKPVAGAQVTVEAATIDVGRNVYQQVMGTTNAEGVFEFEVQAPNTLVGLPLEQGLALINLTVTTTDSAGQKVTKDTLVRVSAEPLNISLVPEGTELIAGIENRLNLFVGDPLGAPMADAVVQVLPTGSDPIEVTTDAFGQAVVLWTPSDAAQQVSVNATAGDVIVSGQVFSFAEQAGTEHVLVRTDKSVYDVGESVKVDVLTSDKQGSVFVDWLNDGQAVDLRTLAPKDGQARFELTLDETLLGDNRIEAYIVQDDGNVVRAGRTVFVRNASGLNIEIESDQAIYAPGAPASLTFKVHDEEGQPTVAALGVQIVDEAVFSLIDAKPGLLQTYFELEDEFAQPTYELHPPVGSLSDILLQRPEDANSRSAAQRKAEATLAALGSSPLMGLNAKSWPKVVSDGKALLAPYFETEKERLVSLANGQVDAAVDAALASGCQIDNYWCDAQGNTLAAVIAHELESRLTAIDFWGNSYSVRSASGDELLNISTQGPDEAEDTNDDETLRIQWDELNWNRAQAVVTQYGGQADAGAVFVNNGGPIENGAVDEAAAGGDPRDPDVTPTASPGTTQTDGTSAPRVRSDFPETLYFNPAIITDSSGKATIDLNLADSITQWRISSMGNSTSGRLGSAVGAMTVFQDFFVDVNFPATLTRGDEVTFPIAVYNYLDVPQTVNLELEPADWYTPTGETALSVELAAGEVKGVSFPVRVDEVGLNTLTVLGLGSEKADAVARTVRVIPDGTQVALAQSGALQGSVTHTVQFVDGTVAGSEQLYLNVFPTYVSQAVQGLDSMLQVPSGCFEQTTANAWPNVLITNYMKQTDQITPDVLLKAESLMSAGYQRLLTFEHPGGGFSWFGTQDPAPFLSVTAFGLMEFSDMEKVHTVDSAMLQRTLAYLLSQQQPDGSWAGDTSEFFSFHTSGLRNTAFTLMAIGSAKYTGPETQLGVEYIKQQLQDDSQQDAYTLALAANALASVAPNDPMLTQLLDGLAEMAVADPTDDTLLSWDTGGTQTTFYGYGNDAEITATALVVHAMLLSGGYSDYVTRGLNKLSASKDSLGNFGSTQATVWTLKTLLLAATLGTDPAIGDFFVEVDGNVIQSLKLTAEQSDVMTTVDLSPLATTGEHEVALTFSGEGKVSYNLVSAYNVPWLAAPARPEGPLSVSVDYDRTQLAVDETVMASVVVTNNTEQTQNMALVTLGLPPGFEVQRDDFAAYLADGTLSRFEVTGKQVILYVSELTPGARLQFDYRLKATMPVTASDGGASVHLYYQPDQKSNVAEQTLTVVAAQ